MNDHHSVYDNNHRPKRYLSHSHHRTWEWLLRNERQYFNRLTASTIIYELEKVGSFIEDVDIELCDIERAEVHSDYQLQSDEDLKAVRLNIKAPKELGM